MARNLAFLPLNPWPAPGICLIWRTAFDLAAPLRPADNSLMNIAMKNRPILRCIRWLLLSWMWTGSVQAAYTVNAAEGTVTDTVTGLIWDQCSWGQSGACTGTASTHTWSQALGVAVTANGQNYKGHNDWRLPSLTELRSLVAPAMSNPVISVTAPLIDTTAFPATPANRFWSSTVSAPSPAGAWFVGFGDGYADAGGQSSYGHVRLVRSGQSFSPFDGFPPPATLAPATQTVTGTVGTVMTATTAFTPTGFSGVMNYTISPALPGGLAMNALTGVISGTPTAAQPSTSHTVTATGSTSGSATATISLSVAQGTQTIAFGSAPTPTYAPGGTFSVSAIASSSLTVTYSSQTPGVCTTGGSATITIVTAGPCTIAANQAGNANWTAAPQATQAITIAQASQSGLTATATPNSIAVNGTSTLNTTGGNGTGTVTYAVALGDLCTVSGSTLTGVGAGLCTVTATRAADTNYLAATSSGVSVTVALNPQAPLTVTPSTLSVPADQSVTLSTTGGSGNGTVTHTAVAQPDATVQTANSRTVAAASVLTCGINGNILTPTGGTGRCLVTTTKAADGPYAAATAQSTITVTAASPPSNPIPTLGEWAQRVMLLLMIAAARHGRRLRAGD